VGLIDLSQCVIFWSPDGKCIVLESDVGGNELFDLYAVPANGGAVITPGSSPASQHVTLVLGSHDLALRPGTHNAGAGLLRDRGAHGFSETSMRGIRRKARLLAVFSRHTRTQVRHGRCHFWRCRYCRRPYPLCRFCNTPMLYLCLSVMC
jgi:hypothetical protein